MKKSGNFPKVCFHSILDKRKNWIDTKIKMPFLEIRFRHSILNIYYYRINQWLSFILAEILLIGLVSKYSLSFAPV